MEQKNKHYFLKGLLIIQTLGLLIYSVITIQNDGANFLARAQEFATSMTWMGQFALDFQCYLILSALWIAWRDKFSLNSIIIAIVAMILGIIVFAPYLLYLLSKEKGDLKRILIGNR
ncbi:hypothetical protein MATR_13090 [Marivirga tractuosa]|uniref:DUF2834 domain-containing protein n=1 Tax=Marivirga tractuosa (strain ATCC 23168 / DSM 4126 / NBRC 15989 / NCIMB 1408 / VKM B-1430 / H-43) TaxID=643867 RepID=E4TUV6_MARTH|nr:hypothetical protein [Marivirga tractuosa]ADR21061.1 hypothetical protein Ftrac_1065 [Marivirga tractuosa DSM 4126]BDD14484.1 hypothetical protein MATR_13090 [Marivirga tractuosa]